MHFQRASFPKVGRMPVIKYVIISQSLAILFCREREEASLQRSMHLRGEEEEHSEESQSSLPVKRPGQP